jgi:hypothetical protein
MTEEPATLKEMAQAFCKSAFGPLGVETAPYAAIIEELLQHAAAAERERCARVVEAMPIHIYKDSRTCKPATFADAAAAIRGADGQQPPTDVK